MIRFGTVVFMDIFESETPLMLPILVVFKSAPLTPIDPINEPLVLTEELLLLGKETFPDDVELEFVWTLVDVSTSDFEI